MARSRKSQSKHDARVSELARRYENQGCDVKADVGGFSKPATIGGYRPDVVAKKGRTRTSAPSREALSTSPRAGSQPISSPPGRGGRRTKRCTRWPALLKCAARLPPRNPDAPLMTIRSGFAVDEASCSGPAMAASPQNDCT